jgi:hypothetical protein
MSVFYVVSVPCPSCGAENKPDWAASVNADRRPDLRAAILDGSFQAIACTACAAPLQLPAHLTYLDTGRGQWILVENPAELAGWSAQEAAAKALFAESYGSAAPAAARSLAEHMHPRLVYGWPALREKLLCQELGLDDVTLELLKLAMLRDGQGPSLGGQEALRLAGGTAEALQLELVDEAADQVLGSAEVPRAGYDAIAADAAGWAALRARFDGAAYVDAARLTMAG